MQKNTACWIVPSGPYAARKPRSAFCEVTHTAFADDVPLTPGVIAVGMFDGEPSVTVPPGVAVPTWKAPVAVSRNHSFPSYPLTIAAGFAFAVVVA